MTAAAEWLARLELREPRWLAAQLAQLAAPECLDPMRAQVLREAASPEDPWHGTLDPMHAQALREAAGPEEPWQGTLDPMRARVLREAAGPADPWQGTLALLREYAGTTGKCPAHTRLYRGVDLGRWAAEQRLARLGGRLPAEKAAALEAVPGWEWKASRAEAWRESLELLRDFAEAHGRCPTYSEEHNGYALGRWASKQRCARRSGRMPEEKARELEAVPHWRWGGAPREVTWQERLELLREYVREAEELPQRSTVYKGVSLGEWVNAQRRDRKRGAAWITEERARALESVPGWSWESSRRGSVWWERLEALREYVREARGLPRHSAVYKGANLGAWVRAQRYDRRAGSPWMTEERVRALESVPGWWWDREAGADAWRRNLELLREYVREAGALPPAGAVYRGANLGAWAHTQRRRWREGSPLLTEEKLRALEAIPGWQWGAKHEDAWLANLELLHAYAAAHGRCPPHAAEYEGVRLGKWAARQREQKRRAALPEAKVQALEAVPGWRWEQP